MSKEKKLIAVQGITQGNRHYGGAWKVAYADFVTAMMAFFLLLWLLNVTDAEQRNAISNYFDPTHPKVSQAESGAGGVMGGLSMSPKGAMATNKQSVTTPPPSEVKPTAVKPGESKKKKRMEKAKAAMKKKEEERFKSAEEKLKKAIEDSPALKALAKNLMVDMTPEGLRIQVVDDEGKPMFASGSARMFEKTKTLMAKIGDIIKDTPNELSVRGHTDSVGYGPGADYTNWELSSDRANASRRVLIASGITEERLNNVVGKAATDPLLPDDPKNPRNRRISIVLLKEELTNPDYEKMVEEESLSEEYDEEVVEEDWEEWDEEPTDDFNAIPGQGGVPIGTFQKTPGAVEFP